MAHGLFSELNQQLQRTSAAELMARRISVPTRRKAIIALRSTLGRHSKPSTAKNPV